MTAYLFFALIEMAVAIGCLYIVVKAEVGQALTVTATGLAFVVWIGAVFKVMLELSQSDAAFSFVTLVYPYSRVAIVALLILTGIFFVYRLVGGRKLG